MLALSALLTFLPLVGVGLIFYQDPAITVDNLFVSLILLTISGVFALNTMGELKRLTAHRKPPEQAKAAAASTMSVRSLGAAAGVATVTAGRQRGIVRGVQFYESAVGVPNKSIVTLQLNGANSSRVFAFEGDLRDALPVGKKVEIGFRDNGGALDLQEVSYL